MAIICRKHKLLFIMVPGTGCSVVGRVLKQELDGRWLPEQPLRKNGRTLVQRKHNTLSDIMAHGLLTEEERAEYLVFATVRNPFDRWVTYYQRYAGEWVDKYHGFLERQIERDRKQFDLDSEEYKRLLSHRDYQQRMHARRGRIIRAIGFNIWMKVTLLRWYRNGKGEKEGGGRLRPYAFPMLKGVDVVMRQEQLERGLNEILRVAGVEKQVVLPHKNQTPGKKTYTEYYSRSTRWLAELMLNGDQEAFGYSFKGVLDENPTLWLDKQEIGVPNR